VITDETGYKSVKYYETDVWPLNGSCFIALDWWRDFPTLSQIPDQQSAQAGFPSPTGFQQVEAWLRWMSSSSEAMIMEDSDEIWKSDEWFMLKEEVLAKADWKSYACKRKAHTAHHLTYTQGIFCDSEWLIALCRKCHNIIHGK
jgi:hypothetical protein